MPKSTPSWCLKLEGGGGGLSHQWSGEVVQGLDYLLVSGWFLAGFWLVSGWFLAGFWLVSGWFLASKAGDGKGVSSETCA